MKIDSQLAFRPALPCVLNNADYKRREDELKRMDEIITHSGMDERFAQTWLEKWMEGFPEKSVRGQDVRRQLERAKCALRCMILGSWLKMSLRELSTRLAECPLYQWFCGLDRMDSVRVPSKSELHRFSTMVDAQVLKDLNASLIAMAAMPVCEQGNQALQLRNQIELDTIWMDSTAIKAPIHFPVDWVLMRDATRTLMKATLLIRRHGLLKRMTHPAEFISRMNTLCMEMSNLRRKKDSKKARKRVFRKMKQIMKIISSHAKRHRDLLEEQWQKTDWTRPQAQQVIHRMNQVIEKLPKAMEQAHARIIRGQSPANADKILSLYESEVNVIVRGKPNSEIEFGNSLLLAEQEDGLIVDWDLHRNGAPNDSHQLKPCLERIMEAHGQETVEAIGADRQFDSATNRHWLEDMKIYNGVCPRSPSALKNKVRSARFKAIQCRRAQSEARIAILKNDFASHPLQRKGFERREIQIGWNVLSHNLWVLARLARAEEKPQEIAEAA